MGKEPEVKPPRPTTRETRAADFAFGGTSIAAVILAAWAYRNVPHITGLILVSLLLSYAMLPLVDALARRMRRFFAVLLVALAGAGLFGGAITLLVPRVGEEVARVQPQAEKSAEQAKTLWEKARAKIPGPMQPTVDRARERILANERITEFGKKVVGGLTAMASGVIFLPIFMLVMLYRFHRTLQIIEGLIPPRWRPRIRHRTAQLDQLLSGYVRGMLLIAVTIGVMYAIAFKIIGVPLAIPVGLISGFGELIPYVGNTIALIVGTLLALTTGEPGKVLWVWLAFGVVQLFEGMVLGPMVLGKQARLSALVVIIALAIGGDLFGFIGLLFAVPVTAVLKVAFIALADGYRATRFFAQEPDTRPTPDVDEAQRS